MRSSRLGWSALAALLLATTAHGQALTCNGRFEVSYPFLNGFVDVGEQVTMRLAVGAGPVSGGTAFFVNNLDVELSCDADFPIVPSPCVPEGTVAYVGDASIVSNCTTCFNMSGGFPGVPTACVWASDSAGGAVPNAVHVQLPPDVFVRVPANSPVPYCFVDVDVEKIGNSTDKTPNLIEENAGYLASPTPNCPDCFGLCDNFILASQVTQSSALVAPPSGLDFQCRETPRHDAASPGVSVSIADLLGSDNAVKVVRSKDVCSPADLNDLNPGAQLDPIHLVRYALENVNTANFAKPQNVPVNTLLGTFVGDVGAPQHLLVPTAKSIVPDPAPPALPANSANHYLCHTFNNVTPTGKGTALDVIDQFDAFDTKLVGARFLCLAADKKHEGIPFPAAHLLCFETNAEEPGTNESVTIVNQFGTKVVPLTETTLLCIQATL